MEQTSLAPRKLGITGRRLGGVVPIGNFEVWARVLGEQLQVIELRLEEGFYHPLHSHPVNESAGYVLSGSLEMMIGEETLVLGPGETWHHPVGVLHSTRALENTVALEMHSPPRSEYAGE